mmetsp:Transcript_23361/g.29774  ORF Transcript_23361/g.29774 Transcript_23361/m.29774 type:complete len:322 (-) Transcript_23361:66-1031(-)
MGGDAHDPPQMDWMNNFWGNFVPGNAADAYKYEFQQENPFLQHPAPFEEAMKHYQAGSLTDAILALEVSVQRDPQNSDAWRWLGTAHADNDEDKLAISALRRSLEADPENIEALLDAGVSYTNELVQVEALEHLRSWLARHPEYSNIPVPPGSEEASLFEQQRSVIEMFLQAAEINPTDVDIHTVLGVLWNLTREYNHAEEAFKEAVKLDPENPSLWNKLGATQANSARENGSKDAVYAYRKALELKPNYIRAWVNMGISYANRKMYDLAAKYYLKALSLNPTPNHIWSYLRLTLNCMDRHDLAALVEEKNVDLFRSQFTF